MMMGRFLDSEQGHPPHDPQGYATLQERGPAALQRPDAG
jgi:hypothetical protein